MIMDNIKDLLQTNEKQVKEVSKEINEFKNNFNLKD